MANSPVCRPLPNRKVEEKERKKEDEGKETKKKKGVEREMAVVYMGQSLIANLDDHIKRGGRCDGNGAEPSARRLV